MGRGEEASGSKNTQTASEIYNFTQNVPDIAVSGQAVQAIHRAADAKCLYIYREYQHKSQQAASEFLTSGLPSVMHQIFQSRRK